MKENQYNIIILIDIEINSYVIPSNKTIVWRRKK